MAFLHEEEDNHNHKGEKKEQGAEARQTLEAEKVHFAGEFGIVEKFGDHVLLRLASSLSNVMWSGRQAGRQADKTFSLGDFFRIQYLAFGYCFGVSNAIFDFSSAKTIPWACFLYVGYS